MRYNNMNKENKLILYKDEEGRVSVNTRFADEDVWLTQAQLATIYQTTQENVSMHITNIYTDNELDKEGTYKKFLLVRQEGKHVTRDDVKIAKNYLTELELQRLNLLTSQFLDYAEFQALEQNPMTMADWIVALDDQILRLRKNILEGSGTVSHQEAIEKAEREFEIYREREMRLLESDFDKAIKRLKDNPDHIPNNDDAGQI